LNGHSPVPPPFEASAQRAYRGRFAPSPTGPLHLGSLYTALASFLQARSQQGQWHLRIDDADPYRTDRDSVDRIFRALEALGLHWDGPILFQSRRLESYRAALDRLAGEGLVYPCTCSRKELAALAAGRTRDPVYPGTCRNRQIAPRDTSHALRVRAENAGTAFRDRLQGPVEQDLERAVGDFVVYRRDRVYAYHLATVLDDAEQGITEIVRGVDLLDSTPRQILLRRYLGLAVPDYAHVPILVDRHGCKLSKQTRAPAVAADRPSATLFELLVLLNQNPPAELNSAPAADILAWAVANWDIDRLAAGGRIAILSPIPD
jgi:glutamyl-Q tRNA(Asp) synthetase